MIAKGRVARLVEDDDGVKVVLQEGASKGCIVEPRTMTSLDNSCNLPMRGEGQDEGLLLDKSAISLGKDLLSLIGQDDVRAEVNQHLDTNCIVTIELPGSLVVLRLDVVEVACFDEAAE